MGSVYITMSVTLERFFVVVYPLKKIRIKKVLLPVVAALALLYNLPKVRVVNCGIKFAFRCKPHFTPQRRNIGQRRIC